MSDTQANAKAIGCGEPMFVLLIGTPLLFVWDGYVLSHLWNWFAVPFFGAAVMSVAVGCGLTCIVVWCKAGLNTRKKYEKPWEMTGYLVVQFIFGGILLLIGGVAHRMVAA